MKNSFWHLASPLSPSKLAEWEDEKIGLESICCPLSDGHRRAGRRLTDLSVILPEGPVEDFVWTWYSELLIQERALELLYTNGFTGFEVRAVNTRFKNSKSKTPVLWEIVLTGWAGIADPASGIILDETGSCDACSALLYTGLLRPELLIDHSKWDGSDFFMVWPLPRFVFVNENVVTQIEKHQLTGVRILKSIDIQISTDTIAPGRLSYWMPETRAKEFGRSFAID